MQDPDHLGEFRCPEMTEPKTWLPRNNLRGRGSRIRVKNPDTEQTLTDTTATKKTRGVLILMGGKRD